MRTCNIVLVLILSAFVAGDVQAQMTKQERRAIRKEIKQYRRDPAAFQELVEGHEDYRDELRTAEGEIAELTDEIKIMRQRLYGLEDSINRMKRRAAQRQTVVQQERSAELERVVSDKGLKYRIQIGAFRANDLSELMSEPRFIDMEVYDGLYKYHLGNFNSEAEAKAFLRAMRDLQFGYEGFVFEYYDGVRTDYDGAPQPPRTSPDPPEPIFERRSNSSDVFESPSAAPERTFTPIDAGSDTDITPDPDVEPDPYYDSFYEKSDPEEGSTEPAPEPETVEDADPSPEIERRPIDLPEVQQETRPVQPTRVETTTEPDRPRTIQMQGAEDDEEDDYQETIDAIDQAYEERMNRETREIEPERQPLPDTVRTETTTITGAEDDADDDAQPGMQFDDNSNSPLRLYQPEGKQVDGSNIRLKGAE